MATTPQFVSITEVARRVGVPMTWLRDEAKAGRVPHLQTGRRLLFNVEVVEQALLERTQQCVPKAAPA